MKLSLKDSFGMVPVGTRSAASPLYVRKSSAFPEGLPNEERGFAALFAVKLCFTVDRPITLAAKPPFNGQKNGGRAAILHYIYGKAELFRK